MWRQWLLLSKGEQRGYIILVLASLLLIVVLLILKMVTPVGEEAGVKYFYSDDSKNQPLQYFDTLYINSADITTLSRFGFSNNLIVSLMKRREARRFISDYADLESVWGFDSAMVQGRSHLLSYEILDEKSYYQKKSRARAVYLHLFYSDSLDFAKAGVPPRYIDSIVSYRKQYIMKGSITSDSLLSLDFNSFIAFLNQHKGNRKTLKIENAVADVVTTVRQVVEINSADTLELMQLKGVNRFVAARIIEYRARLGGFVDSRQLLEVNSFTEDVLKNNDEYIAVNELLVVKIPVNSAGVDKLRRHPYISFYLAKEIVETRKKRSGRYDNLQQLKGLPSFDGASPYLLQYLSVD